jgi:hypothetical protein
MKKYNKILLYFFAGTSAIIFIAIFVIAITSSGKISKNNKMIEMEYKISGFSGISVSGEWKVFVEKGNDYNVNVKVAEDELQYLVVENKDNILSVKRKRAFMDFEDKTYEKIITVTMPELKLADMAGNVNVLFKNFNSEELKLSLSGNCKVAGTENTIGRLFIDISGNSYVNLIRSETKDSDVRISGNGSVKLNMAGGNLTGSISGNGEIVYKGTVEKMSVHQAGNSTIKKEQG